MSRYSIEMRGLVKVMIVTRGILFTDILPVGKELDCPDAREKGIYITPNELATYFLTPWIRCYVRYIDGDFAGFGSFNISEARWGRCELQEFYLPERWRKGYGNWRFFKWLLAHSDACHRVIARVKEDNTVTRQYLERMGWKKEAVLDGFTPAGETFIQYALRRGAGR